MGGKRVRSDTSFQPKKKQCDNRSSVGDDDNDDRISQLPDDIIVDILSFLSLKEAGRTSILSSRWINLWKHTPYLDFDAGSELEKILRQSRSEFICSGAHNKYLKWVNSVIRAHKSPTLKEFRICFPLDTSAKNAITWWLQFASCRQVQSLELDFTICNSRWQVDNRFPAEVLFAPRISMPLDFKSLRALSFSHVTMSAGAIEFFLSNCPLLEQLIVAWSEKISKLEVCGSSLVLKHLEIVGCTGLESLKVSAPSLTSLVITSVKGVLLENVPMLVDVCVAFQSVKCLFSVLCCCASQLETLELMPMRCSDGQEDELCLRNFPEMPKLKKLVIEYGHCDESLITLASFTKASPYLQEFVLKNTHRRVDDIVDDDVVDDDVVDDVVDDAAASIIWFRHEHLKVFKFVGYQGRPCDDELVHYMLENCVVLEKIIIDPCNCNLFCLDRLRLEEAARKKAKQHLQPQLPHHVELVIL